MNYIRWEEDLVRMKFACPSKNKAEQKKEGYVIFLQGQVKRYMSVDKYALFLDESAKKQAGRPSSTPSAAGIAETGEAKSKSAKKVTVQFGVAGNEALPFHIIVPSSVKEGNRYPNACEMDEYRVIIKCDSGIGRSCVECLADMMINGFHLFPGLPNGTEIGQEMDQIYSSLKMGFY